MEIPTPTSPLSPLTAAQAFRNAAIQTEGLPGAMLRCRKCNPTSATRGRRLIVCIDGTSNKFGEKNSNVVELLSQIDKTDDQLTYYNSGIGTYARPTWRSISYLLQVVANTVDLAIAWNFEQIILEAYRWLSNNFREGDQIYLFGFSRGAYQVRVLAGLIQKVGLMFPGNESQIPFAYELYANLDKATRLKIGHEQRKADAVKDEPAQGNLKIAVTKPSNSERFRAIWRKKKGGKTIEDDEFINAEEDAKKLNHAFKRTFSRKHVRVHFIGVWDTVSSVGLRRGKNLPEIGSTNHFCHFRHALALDERRVKFLPEYVCIGQSYREKMVNAESVLPKVKEVWFPGTHSDIGGGNRPNPFLNLADSPLTWMKSEAMSTGLQFIPPPPNVWNMGKMEGRKPTKSLKGIWWFLEFFPLRRLSYDSKTLTTRRLHRGRGRKVLPGQKISPYGGAFQFQDYKPMASLYLEADENSPGDAAKMRRLTWEDFLTQPNIEDEANPAKAFLEEDVLVLSSAITLVEKFNKSNHVGDRAHYLERLTQMATQDDGIEIITEKALPTIIGTITDSNDPLRVYATLALVSLTRDATGRTSVIPQDVVPTLKSMGKSGSKDERYVANLALASLEPEAVDLRKLCDDLFPENDATRPREGSNLRRDNTTQSMKLIEPKAKLLYVVNRILDRCPKDALALEGKVDVIIEAALHCLNSRLQDAQVLGGRVLVELSTYENIRGVMLKADLPTKLIAMCGIKNYTQERAAGVIAWLSHHDNLHEALSRANVLSRLISSMDCKNEITVQYVGETFRELAMSRSEEQRLLKRLLEMLQDHQHPERQCAAAGIIQKIVLLDGVRRALKEMGMVEILQKYLFHKKIKTHVEVSRAAADTLVCLCNYDDIRGAFKTSFFSDFIASYRLIHADEDVAKILFKLFQNFLQHADIRKETERHFPSFQTMLTDKEPQIIDRGIKAFAEFARHDTICSQMIRSGLFDRLAKTLQETTDALISSTLQPSISPNPPDEIRKQIVSNKVIPAILDVHNGPPRDMKTYSTFFSGFTEYDDSRQELLSATIFPSFVDMLHEERIIVAAKLVPLLANHDDTIPAMRESNLVQNLVNILSSDDIRSLEASVDALVSVCRHDELRRATISEHITDKMLLMAKSSDLNVNVIACKLATSALAPYVDSQQLLCESGVIFAILKAFGGASAAWQIEISRNIYQMGHYKSIRQKLIEHGAVGKLTGVLTSENVALRFNAAAALVSLDVSDEKLCPIVDRRLAPDCFDVLPELAETFAFLAGRSAKLRSTLVDAGIVQAGLDLLGSSNYKLQVGGAALLVKLAQYDGLQSKMLTPEAIRKLTTKLGSGHRPVRLKCAEILKSLTSDAYSRSQLLSAIPGIVDLHTTFVPGVVVTVADLALYFARHDEFRKALLDNRICETFLRMLKTNDPEILNIGANGFCKLTEYGDAIDTIAELGADILLLSAKTRTDNQKLIHSCTQALATLNRHGKVAKKTMEAVRKLSLGQHPTFRRASELILAVPNEPSRPSSSQDILGLGLRSEPIEEMDMPETP